MRRRVESEGFAALVLLGLFHDRAARRRVVHADPEAGDEAQDEELDRAVEGKRQEGADRQHDQAAEHQRATRGAIGQPAEDRLEDEPRRWPGREDDAQRSRVDPLFSDVQRQHGQQGPEADHGHELGHEDGHDRAPVVIPATQAPDGIEGHAGLLEPAGIHSPLAGSVGEGPPPDVGAEGRHTW